MADKMVKIGDAAKMMGVSIATIRKWEISGELLPSYKSAGGTRFYSVKMIDEKRGI